MNKSITKVQLAIIIISIGFFGFILSEINKSSYKVFEKNFSQTGKYEEVFELVGDEDYKFSVWGRDEEGGFQNWASVDFSLTLKNRKGKIIASENIVSSSSISKDGVNRTGNGFEKYYTADYPDEFKMILDFKEGDEVEIEIYENISDLEHLLPSLFIILAIIGLFYYFRVRNK